jgi:hypothetical protein
VYEDQVGKELEMIWFSSAPLRCEQSIDSAPGRSGMAQR